MGDVEQLLDSKMAGMGPLRLGQSFSKAHYY